MVMNFVVKSFILLTKHYCRSFSRVALVAIRNVTQEAMLSLSDVEKIFQSETTATAATEMDPVRIKLS